MTSVVRPSSAFQRACTWRSDSLSRAEVASVQNQDGRVSRARSPGVMRLRQAGGILAHLGIDALRQAFPRIPAGWAAARARTFCSLDCPARRSPRWPMVVEQHYVLADQGQMRTQAAQREVVDGHVVHQMVPLMASTKRGSMLTSVVSPDRPTRATVWPGSTVKEMLLTVSRSASGKMFDTAEFHLLPRTGSRPVLGAGVDLRFWSINVNTLSADTSIFCMRAATLVRRLMGSKI